MQIRPALVKACILLIKASSNFFFRAVTIVSLARTRAKLRVCQMFKVTVVG